MPIEISDEISDEIKILLPGQPTLHCTSIQAKELRDQLLARFPVSDAPLDEIERPNYFQKLVDLGCKPDDLGTVTWNSVTHGVDVSGSVYLSGKGLTRLPFQFGKVGRSFDCSYNQLTSLDGAPKEVGEDFVCYHNRLTSLKGAPKEVGGNFGCSGNQLTSLEGAPKEVGGDFGCYRNRLTSLEGCPKEVGGNFRCSADDLTDVSDLRGCKIKGAIYLYGPEVNKEQVRELLRTQGYKGEIKLDY